MCDKLLEQPQETVIKFPLLQAWRTALEDFVLHKYISLGISRGSQGKQGDWEEALAFMRIRMKSLVCPFKRNKWSSLVA